MPTLVVVGALWGDEAKGKIVDSLADEASYVVRFSGGANAGHTVVAKGVEHKFHLLPVGILHANVTSVLGGGMVVDPKQLLIELDETRSKSDQIGQLAISENAHVVFPHHRMIDRLEEEARGSKIGTTSRGIGPAYTDKVQRMGIRMGEFVRPTVFQKRLAEVLEFKNRLLKMYGQAPIPVLDLYDEYAGYADRLREYVVDVEGMLLDAVERDDRVLLEGAQGTYLDLDHGTYPFVTSSHPTVAGACLGSGVAPTAIDSALAVCKVYATRVGTGPFPTELEDEVGERIREAGGEYGTTTGRPRRCGWQDGVLLRHAARVNGLSGLVVTCLDVLSGFEEVSIATSYRLNGTAVKVPPSSSEDWAQLDVETTTLPGWSEDLTGIRSYEELPKNAKNYLELMEETVGVPVAAISVGPDREQTIVLRPELFWVR